MADQRAGAEQDASAFELAPMLGRANILVACDAVDASNVVDVLNEVQPAFAANAAQVGYLWRYYKGYQPILGREKGVRPEINNRVVENHAQEIVSFKVGYQLAEPLQYTCRKAEEGTSEGYQAKLAAVNELNTLMFAEDKASCDRDLFEWLAVCGIGFRMVEADRSEDEEEGGAPFELYTLDPRCTFVVRSAAYHRRALMGVWVAKDPVTGETVHNVFTDRACFRVTGGQVVDERPHTYGRVPIVEYQLGNARMGVFEAALPLLDAINTLESSRLDDIEQVVQALMVFRDCDIDADGFAEMREKGAIKVRTTPESTSKPSIEMLRNQLDQTGTQSVKDDLYQAVVNICGMPNRNGASGSSSDTGAAVLLRDGWTLAESHAKSYELQFKRAEREMLRVALEVCRQADQSGIDLRIRDIDLVFNRRNYENILVKAQVLTTMLKSSDVHPQLAFRACGLFTDPEAAYAMSKEHADEARREAQERFGAQSGQESPAEGGEDDGDPEDAEATPPKGAGSQAGTPEPRR